MSSHSELKRTSSRSSVASTLPACSTYVRACASISSPESTGRVAERPARVPDARGVVADDQHDRVAGVLELAQLLQDDGVAEVEVGRRRVQAELDAQRPARSRAAARERPRGQAVDRVAGQVRRRPGGLGAGFGHPGQC